MSLYFDYAAATPLDSDVLAAMQPYFSLQFHNPSALYGPALAVSKALETARSEIANVLGAKTPEIIFAAGGTEANNLAIHGIMQQYPDGQIAYSAIEHDSVRYPAQQYNSYEIPVNTDGLVVPDLLQISDNTVLVSIMYANNEIGTVQPIKQIAAVLQQIKQQRTATGNSLPLYFHVDAAQAGNYLDMHVHRLGVDLLTINGGKLYGPKQTGALFIKTGVKLQPQINGGGQERNLRSGTENVAGAVGLAAALTKSVVLRHDESQRLRDLQKEFINLIQQAIPNVVINGSLKQRLPNNIHITLSGQDNERLLMALDMQGIYTAAGSACSASHDEPSHVLRSIGLSDQNARSSLRFSMGRATTIQDIRTVIEAIVHTIKK